MTVQLILALIVALALQAAILFLIVSTLFRSMTHRFANAFFVVALITVFLGGYVADFAETDGDVAVVAGVLTTSLVVQATVGALRDARRDK